MSSSEAASAPKSAWLRMSEEETRAAFDFAQEYKRYISACKTEWEAASYIIGRLSENGFTQVSDLYSARRQAKPGDRIYAVNRDRAVCAAVIGREPPEQAGYHIVASHLDSPVVYLRPDPLTDLPGVAVARTFSRGGTKPFQWPVTPLALHGKLIRPDGSVQELVVGEDEDDPVFYIDDLSAHLSAGQYEKTLREGVKPDHLDVILSSLPAADGKARPRLVELLSEKYGISERSLAGAEIYVVPASKARDVGFDRALVAAYGQDDRLCAYASLMALLNAAPAEHTAVCMFQDKEELGSIGNTSASSDFFPGFLSDLYELQTGGCDRYGFKSALSASKVLNGDVTTLLEPPDRSMLDERNNAPIGCGGILAKYISNTLFDYTGRVMNLFDRHGVVWQANTSTLDRPAIGGSVAQSFNERNMDVINFGPGLFAMHSTWELVSKADLYMTYRGYRVFFEHPLD